MNRRQEEAIEKEAVDALLGARDHEADGHLQTISSQHTARSAK